MNYRCKKSALEAFRIMKDLERQAGIPMQQLAEINGCSCGYELMKKIAADIESKDKMENKAKLEVTR